MRALLNLAVCGALLASGAMAQRGGGGHGGGGMGGGGFRGGGGMGGGFRGGAVGGFRGGFGGFRGGFGGFRGGFGGFRGGFFRGGRFFGGCGWGGFCGGFSGIGIGWGWPSWGWGGWPGYGLGYADSGYLGASYGDYPGSSGGYAFNPASGGQPNTVNVIYPPTQTSVYVERANPVIHEYDQYGQQISDPEGFSGGGSISMNSPIYLIASKDHTITAALAYSITGSLMQYTTLDHQQKVVQLIQIDRDLTLRLNRERHVSFQMPQ